MSVDRVPRPGVLARARVLNYLVRFGWSHGDQEVFSLDELVAAFDWEHCGRSDGKFDAKKFLAINHEHLKTPRLTGDDEYAERRDPVPRARRARRRRAIAWRPCVPLIRERAHDVRRRGRPLDFVFREPPAVDEAAVDEVPRPRRARRACASFAASSRRSSRGRRRRSRRASTRGSPSTGLPMKDVAQPARVALTGRTASPGLFDVIAVLGRARALARLTAAADRST